MDADSTDSNGGSFYAILNVPGDASEDDIKKSFRQLAQAYHPDKHTDPALKAHAAAQFTKLQEAYEVTLTLPTHAQAHPFFQKSTLCMLPSCPRQCFTSQPPDLMQYCRWSPDF